MMPGYDEYISVPEHLDPPQMGNDDTLPSQVHPSYPYGRPEIKKNGARGPGPRALDSAATSLLSVGEKRNNEWADLNLGALLERSDGKEVPPVMAVSLRCGLEFELELGCGLCGVYHPAIAPHTLRAMCADLHAGIQAPAVTPLPAAPPVHVPRPALAAPPAPSPAAATCAPAAADRPV